MRSRAFLMASISAIALLSGGSAYAAPATVVQGVEVDQVANSTLGLNGGRPVHLTGGVDTTDVCGYDFQRWDGYHHRWLDLGATASNQQDDYISGATLNSYRVYKVIGTDCNGNDVGNGYLGNPIRPTSDNTTGNDTVTGPFIVVANANAFDGDIQQVSGLGSQVTWDANSDWNFGIYGETGPQGGLATVYVDRVPAGTINFYSPTLTHFRSLLFAHNGGIDDIGRINFNVSVQMTTPGAGHGTTMYLDAVSQDHSG